MIDQQLFECFFDGICDIVDRVNVLRHNLYSAASSWIKDYESFNAICTERTSIMNPEL